jgi:Domain of unknown function (DUF6268)
MQKIYSLLLFFFTASPLILQAQDTTSSASDEPLEVFDVSLLSDAADAKTFCTQKVSNQTPTRLISLGYEYNTGFTNTNGTKDKINGMGGLRAGLQVLAISTNKMILSIGANYWGAKVNTSATNLGKGNNQLYNNRMDMQGLNALLFKPLDKKHFIIAQLNADVSAVGNNNNWFFDSKGITAYGSVIYGWKKNDYKMSGFGISRTYRLGRPLFVPIFLYNKTFNQHWGVEMLLPARAHVRYNVSTTNMLLAGLELEGQQYFLQPNVPGQTDWWLQRGEIKPRVAWEKKLYGFIWLSAQAGYRLGYRYNVVDAYDGGESKEITINKWGSSPYFNISVNFVTP